MIIYATTYWTMTTNASGRTSGKSIVEIFEGEYRGGWGNRKNRALARTIGWFDIKSWWLACPGRDERRVLATPDGTDALSDVKLKHAALTRRFDDTPYNLTSYSLAPSLCPILSSLAQSLVSYLFLPSRDSLLSPLVSRLRQAAIAIVDHFVPHRHGYFAYYARRMYRFFLNIVAKAVAHFTEYRQRFNDAVTSMTFM